MERSCAISGTGVWHPPDRISNAELVASLRTATERWNLEHKAEIESGSVQARDLPDEHFIVKASGVESRYVIDKHGVLDPTRLRPHLRARGEDEPSLQCEASVAAIRAALDQAGRRPDEVDAVIVACSNLQRAYPAIAIEVQNALGASGWAYDLNAACSSATFGLQVASDAIARGRARCVVVVNPEIMSGHSNFERRDYHFIFGDACAAAVVEPADATRSEAAWEVLDTRLTTRFSNNIRNDFGFLNVCEGDARTPEELMFRQNGRRVFREVCPMVAKQIIEHLDDLGLEPSQVRRMWLHQANQTMNLLIAKTVLGRAPKREEAPMILDEFANTSSAGSMIAFHRHRADLASGAIGVICSFGAGYSVGSVVVRRR